LSASVNLSGAKRTLFEKALAGHLQTGLSGTAIPQRPGGMPAPISLGQEQIWFLSHLDPEAIAYNEAVTISKRGALDVAALELAFNEIVRRHEIWRTTFPTVDGRPVQVVHPPSSYRIPMVDLTALPEGIREAEAFRIATEEGRRPYDLERGPFLRPVLARLREDDHRLLLAMHHIVFDGVGLYRIVMPELIALYDAFSHGRPSPLPEPPIQYADFATWQRTTVTQEALEPRLAYWRKQLGGRLPVLQLPTDRPRPPLQTFSGGIARIALPQGLSNALQELSRREGVTLFMTLVAALNVLLHRYSGQEQVVLATVVDGRRRSETEGLIGFFLDPVVLRTNLGGAPSFRRLLGQVRETTLSGLANVVPFETLVRELQPERDLSRNPIFQVLFAMEPPLPPIDPQWRLDQMDAELATCKFDLYLELDERPGEGIIGRFVYNTDLFEGATIQRMIGHWETLLEGIVADPNTSVAELPLLTAGERADLQVEWEASRRDYPRRGLIQDFFEAQARRQPEATAIEFGQHCLTYGALDASANQLAHHLRRLGVGPEALCGICVDRGLDMVVALLAVLKAGGAYLPLDPGYPKERLRFMLSDARIAVLLTQERLVARLPEQTAPVVLLDAHRPAIAGEPTSAPVPRSDPENLAYVIYTSGSTGTPKGVMIEHRGVVNHLAALVSDYDIGPDDAVLQLPSLSFHPSVRDILGTLSAGARLVLLGEAGARDPRTIVDAIATRGVTCLLSLVPSLARLLLDEPNAASLRLILTCGESLRAEDARRLRDRFGCQVANQFGPTECIMAATKHTFGAADEARATVLAGRSEANARVYILGRAGEPVPVGVPGELYVGGESLARGYLRRPELTAERFLANPFSREAGARVYRTGDLARRLGDGSLEFIGRLDDQVKVRGFRVELGEVETALARHPGVREVALAASGERLIGYVVPRERPGPSAHELRQFLRERLPNYMVPAVIIDLEAMPLTPAGKVDRRSLPKPDSERADREGRLAPRTPTEEVVGRIWAEALGVQEVGVCDDFFDLGGHSLLAVRVIREVEKAFRRRLPLTTFFQEGTTVERLAAVLARDFEDESSQLLVKARTSGSLPPLFFVFSDESALLSLRHLLDPLGPEQPVYGLLPERRERRFDRTRRVEDLAAGVLSVIREVQASGPYHLCGHSLGGVIAYELARQLRAAGEEVAYLGIVDAMAPAATERWLRSRLALRARLGRQLRRSFGEGTAKLWEVADRETRAALRRVIWSSAEIAPDEFDHDGAIAVGLMYRPGPYDGSTVLFTTAVSRTASQSLQLGWEEVVGRRLNTLEVREMPGDHLTMLKEPNVAVLAEALAFSLRNAQAAQGNGASASGSMPYKVKHGVRSRRRRAPADSETT
jgi:amino acid adenylation domain-containing protein